MLTFDDYDVILLCSIARAHQPAMQFDSHQVLTGELDGNQCEMLRQAILTEIDLTGMASDGKPNHKGEILIGLLHRLDKSAGVRSPA